MARDAKSLRVTLEAIRCSNAEGDSGANLEIFGQLEARGVTTDTINGQPRAVVRHVLWSRSENDGGMNIAPNTEIPVNKSVAFPVFQRDFLWIGGRMVEDDDFSDDVLGDGFRIMNYDSLKTDTVTVGFEQDEQEILARYRIEVLGVLPNHGP